MDALDINWKKIKLQKPKNGQKCFLIDKNGDLTVGVYTTFYGDDSFSIPMFEEGDYELVGSDVWFPCGKGSLKVKPKVRPIKILESPYASKNEGIQDGNVKYAQLCMKDMLKRGESPYASHLLYTQENVLDDDIQEERDHGTEAGFAFKHLPDSVTVFYTDRGVSDGMLKAWSYCVEHNLKMEVRQLEGYLK